MLSIIVLSSDGYSDCFQPFFKLLKKNFPGVEQYEIILSTNTKQFEYPGLDIKVLAHGEKVPWSKRLRLSLEQAKNEIVLVLIEDIFLRTLMNVDMLKGFLELMHNTKEIDHIRLLSTPDRTEVTKSEYENLEKIKPRTKLRFLYLPGLWKKNVLIKYVVDHESPFVSEKLGDFRSYICKHGFYAVSSDNVVNGINFYDCRPSGALFKGKWSNWVPQLFKENNIDLDLELRGFVTDDFAKASRLKSKMDMLKSPISTFKSFWAILTLYVKSKLKLLK